jgi:HKD family nuclease
VTRPRGFYDQVLTEGLDHALTQLAPDIAHVEPLQGESVVPRIVDAVREQLERILASIGGEQTDRALAQLELVNSILRGLRARSALTHDLVDPLVVPPRVLHAIRGPSEEPPALPETGLVMPWLFTAGPGTPALLPELRREAASCDHLDILVSFITKSGVRKLLDVFREITAADASGTGQTRIRVLTTTYLGATEIDALDDLARLNGTEVRVSLDGRRSRLHAKAWIFRRRTGFGSAYVGSANFSHVALAAGLEWTVKFTQRGQQALFSRAEAHFDSLWEDKEFERYDPEDQAMRLAVRVALGLERGDRDEVPTG